MMDYKGAQAYIATDLLLEVCLSIKLFGQLHGENLCHPKMRTTLATHMLLAFFMSQMYKHWSLRFRKTWRKSYL